MSISSALLPHTVTLKKPAARGRFKGADEYDVYLIDKTRVRTERGAIDKSYGKAEEDAATLYIDARNSVFYRAIAESEESAESETETVDENAQTESAEESSEESAFDGFEECGATLPEAGDVVEHDGAAYSVTKVYAAYTRASAGVHHWEVSLE